MPHVLEGCQSAWYSDLVRRSLDTNLTALYTAAVNILFSNLKFELVLENFGKTLRKKLISTDTGSGVNILLALKQTNQMFFWFFLTENQDCYLSAIVCIHPGSCIAIVSCTSSMAAAIVLPHWEPIEETCSPVCIAAGYLTCSLVLSVLEPCRPATNVTSSMNTRLTFTISL